MTNSDIAHRRLHNQHIAGNKLETPAEVVRWLGAVQSQDYGNAKWAVGQRTNGLSDVEIEQAFTDGAILRTHVMRPTWHFVTREDIRWMLELTAPRVNQLSATYYRRQEMDDAFFARSNAVIVDALQGGKQLTRVELASALQQAGIETSGEFRMGFIMMRAELDAVICSGARRGKQFTYALLDERAPQAKSLLRDEALAELVTRYFTSHGPATPHDFSWWSGLTVADAKAGLEMVKSRFDSEEIDGKTYWFAPSAPIVKDPSPTAYLLPNYDEYISYADRTAVFKPEYGATLSMKGNILYSHFAVIDGEIVSMWRRTLKKREVVIETSPFRPFTPAKNDAFAAAARRFGDFLGLSVVLE